MVHLDPQGRVPTPRQSAQDRRVFYLPDTLASPLRIRAVEPADARALAAIFSHPEVAVCLSVNPLSAAAFEDWILLSRARHAEHRSDCCTVLSAAGDVVGLLMGSQSQALPDVVEIGVVLAPHLWGTGGFLPVVHQYLDRIFAAWPTSRVVCRVLVRNQRGMAALRKLGARQIGHEPRGSEIEYLWEIPRTG